MPPDRTWPRRVAVIGTALVLVLAAAAYLIEHISRPVSPPAAAPGCQAGTGLQADLARMPTRPTSRPPSRASRPGTGCRGRRSPSRTPRRCRNRSCRTWTTATATPSASSSSGPRRAGAPPARSRTRSTPRPGSSPPCPECATTPGCRSTPRHRPCSTARTRRLRAVGDRGGPTGRLLHRQLTARRLLLVRPARQGGPGGRCAQTGPDVRAAGAGGGCGGYHHRSFGQTERKRRGRARPAGRRPGRWPAGWSRTRRLTASAKYGMPVMSGKRRMAVWAGSETPRRTIRRAALLSRAEAAPAESRHTVIAAGPERRQEPTRDLHHRAALR